MIGRSLPEYVFIRVSISALRLIAPLSLVYLAGSWCANNWIYSKWLGYYALIEAVFYLGVYIPRSRFLQHPATHPTPLTRTQREELFARCFARVRDADLATGWFHFSSMKAIRRDNVVEWILWALFSTSRDACLDEWEEELDGYIKAMEGLMGRQLADGYNEEIKCIKVTLDPVVSAHRPLLWYMIVATVDCITGAYLLRSGFQHYSLWKWYLHFPPRLVSPFCTPSTHPQVPYWYRPHRSTTKHPLLFLHGIGIGLWPYVPFLAELAASDPDVGIIAIENLSISMRISPPPLTRADMLIALIKVLDFHHFEHVVVCGHSYGTVVSAHMMRDPELSQRVKAWVLVDPIPFLLHLPSVAYNFVYREPRTANEWQLWYFASRDPDVARALARHFFWVESILWKEDLKGRRVGVLLSGTDQIVDAEEVRAYLTEQEVANDRWQSEDGQLEVLWYPGLDHATIFDSAKHRYPLLELLERFIEIDSDAGEHHLETIHRL